MHLDYMVEAFDTQQGPGGLDRPDSQSLSQKARRTTTTPIFGAGVRTERYMAERAGFEPAMEFDPHTRLAGECLQPLGHLSRGLASKFRRTAARPVLPDAARPVQVSLCGRSGRRR
jgi:hypothetical protein